MFSLFFICIIQNQICLRNRDNIGKYKLLEGVPLVWRTLVVFAANREVCNVDGSGYERVERGKK